MEPQLLRMAGVGKPAEVMPRMRDWMKPRLLEARVLLQKETGAMVVPV